MLQVSRACSIDDHGHRTVVDERYFHVRGKHASLHMNATVCDEIGVSPIESIGKIGVTGGGERGTPPFAAVAQQCELADHKCGTADVDQRAIHLALVVWEDSKFDGFVG